VPNLSRDPELRVTSGTVTIRSAEGENSRRIGGYALKFSRLSRNLGGFVERVAPGAVNKSIADRLDVLCRFQHRDEYLLGRVRSGTLRLSVDETGLDYEVDVPDTTAGRDVSALAARGDLAESSFAFVTMQGGDEWTLTDQDYPLRTLHNIKLIDVAPVISPAYLDTSTGLRSLAESRSVGMDEVEKLAAENRLATLLAPNKHETYVDLSTRAGKKPPPDDEEDADKKKPADGKPADGKPADGKKPADDDGDKPPFDKPFDKPKPGAVPDDEDDEDKEKDSPQKASPKRRDLNALKLQLHARKRR
jgi:HK97 family phage prohead protease